MEGSINKFNFHSKNERGDPTIYFSNSVTSGSSVIETMNELNNVGLICKNAFCIVDREQGGAERLEKEGIKLHSLIRINSILDYLVKMNQINPVKRAELADQLKNPQYEKVSAEITTENWEIRKRFAAFHEGTLNRKLVNIMLEKKTNLCLAVDECSKERILKIVEKIGSFICVLKLHCDTIDGWDQKFASELRTIADSKNFLLFEDRKLADTANTMELQLTNGYYRIAEWADLVTIYPEPGKKSIETLKSIVDSPNYKLSAFLMIAELSTEGAKTNAQNGVEVAEAIGSKMIGGFICQKRCSESPKFLYWTPGVNLRKSADGKGQRWRGPEQAILEDGCDIIIVGRGVTDVDDDDVAEIAQRYADSAWEALTKC